MSWYPQKPGGPGRVDGYQERRAAPEGLVDFGLERIDGWVGIVVGAVDASGADLQCPGISPGGRKRIGKGPGDSGRGADFNVGVEAHLRVLTLTVALHDEHQSRRKIVGVGPAEPCLRAVAQGVGGAVVGIGELAHSRLQPEIERAPRCGKAQEAEAAAARCEILIVAEQNLVADSVNEEAALFDADAPQVEGWTERRFEEIEVDVGEIEIVRVIGQKVELDAVSPWFFRS